MSVQYPSRPWRLLAAAALAGALVGCNILPEARTYDLYRLPPSAVADAGEPPVDWALRITRPAHNDLLGTASIAVLPEGHRLSVYEGARWTSPVPILWRDHLLEAFQNDGRVRQLSTDADMLRADLELGGVLRAFQTEYRDGAPHVVIRLDAQLVDLAGRRLHAGRRFEVIEPTRSAEVPAVVEAFGRAGDRLAAALIDWTLREGAAAH
ncbi:membrane integrity-associated transporter subunit PqiC [Ectothiorhodospiraceae bacterium 2226]|nr:membrane integrity-associated transporter subunit PqiC [Ectothiorhodospiraceae bacterium 2226]